MLTLVIGNRNYSSWSLRAWLFLRESGIPFEEVRIALFVDNWLNEISEYSPARRVPALVDGPIRVWDSLAIMQYLREKLPQTVDWPKEQESRAHARSIVAEMHSGFIAIRGELPQNIRRRTQLSDAQLSEGCKAQIARIIEIWTNCRSAYGDRGPWLFGNFSIADVMFIPVALRFRTYGICVPSPASDYVEAVVALPAVQEWCAAAAEESETISFIDELVPAGDSPLTLG